MKRLQRYYLYIGIPIVLICSVDQTGNSNFSKLFTMTDLIHSVGDGNFNQNQVDQTRLYGGETTSALLQKMLEEGRLVVQ